jgi:uncharacterized protein YuzE
MGGGQAWACPLVFGVMGSPRHKAASYGPAVSNCVLLSAVRITYDHADDAAYIYLTDEPLTPGRDTVICDLPDDARGFVAMDWKDGKIVGLEVLTASSVLHADLLAQARPPGASKAGASQPET